MLAAFEFALSRNANSFYHPKHEKNGGRTSDDTVNRQVPMSEKKKARNIGSKNKRLLMHADDAMELRITWEEIQELLRPSPTAKPNIVVVEDCEFEEYEVSATKIRKPQKLSLYF